MGIEKQTSSPSLYAQSDFGHTGGLLDFLCLHPRKKKAKDEVDMQPYTRMNPAVW